MSLPTISMPMPTMPMSLSMPVPIPMSLPLSDTPSLRRRRSMHRRIRYHTRKRARLATYPDRTTTTINTKPHTHTITRQSHCKPVLLRHRMLTTYTTTSKRNERIRRAHVVLRWCWVVAHALSPLAPGVWSVHGVVGYAVAVEVVVLLVVQHGVGVVGDGGGEGVVCVVVDCGGWGGMVLFVVVCGGVIVGKSRVAE